MGVHVTLPVNRLAYTFGGPSTHWRGPASVWISPEPLVRRANPFPSGFPYRSEITAKFFRRDAQSIETATYSPSAIRYLDIKKKKNFIKDEDDYTCLFYNDSDEGYFSIYAFLSDDKFLELHDIARSYHNTEYRINFSCRFNGFRNEHYTDETVPSADEFLEQGGAYISAGPLEITLLPPKSSSPITHGTEMEPRTPTDHF